VTTIATIKKQLAALLLIAKPPNSLAARLDALSDDDRAAYERYSERLLQWIKASEERNDMDDIEPAARPYARMIDGYGPQLSARISNALYPMITISKDASDEQAAQIWFDEVMR
jgi:hypothetical protein